jgi:hypothetical protein
MGGMKPGNRGCQGNKDRQADPDYHHQSPPEGRGFSLSDPAEPREGVLVQDCEPQGEAEGQASYQDL